jgi:hypothetical protein
VSLGHIARFDQTAHACTEKTQQVFKLRGMGGTEMADPAYAFSILHDKVHSGPDPTEWYSHEVYQNLRKEVEAFIFSLKQRYSEYMKTAPLEVKRSYNNGPKVLPADWHLFEQAVDLHQFVVDKLSYWSGYDTALTAKMENPHAYALETVNAPWHTTSRKLYRLPPLATTGSRMQRYGYGFK